LTITIDFEKDRLTIKFTSKILGLGFIDLINVNTICQCLSSIHLVEFDDDVEDILDEFKVMTCDVTKDVSYGYDIKKRKQEINSSLKNYDKWKCENYQNGFALRNVVGKQYKKRLVIYNKGNELKLEKNRAFVDSVDNFDEGSLIHEYYRDKVRFEMNINTKAQVRELLGIKDNKLMSVLNSDANPILTLLNEVLLEPDVNNRVISTMKEYHCELTLKDGDFDLGKVEAKIRSLYSKNTQISDVMKPYRALHQRLKSNTAPAFDLRKLVV
jgi:hypothetical protein